MRDRESESGFAASVGVYPNTTLAPSARQGVELPFVREGKIAGERRPEACGRVYARKRQSPAMFSNALVDRLRFRFGSGRADASALRCIRSP